MNAQKSLENHGSNPQGRSHHDHRNNVKKESRLGKQNQKLNKLENYSPSHYQVLGLKTKITVQPRAGK